MEGRKGNKNRQKGKYRSHWFTYWRNIKKEETEEREEAGRREQRNKGEKGGRKDQGRAVLRTERDWPGGCHGEGGRSSVCSDCRHSM